MLIQQARDLAGLLGAALELDERPMPLPFRRGSVRVLVVVPQARCRELFGGRVARCSEVREAAISS